MQSEPACPECAPMMRLISCCPKEEVATLGHASNHVVNPVSPSQPFLMWTSQLTTKQVAGSVINLKVLAMHIDAFAA